MKKLFALFLILISVFSLFACDLSNENPDGKKEDPNVDVDPVQDLTQLASPSISISDENLVTWAAVPNAKSYIVIVGTSEHATTQLKYDAKNETVGAEIKVIAVGDGVTYSSSSYSNIVSVKAPQKDTAVYVAVENVVKASDHADAASKVADIYARSGLTKEVAASDATMLLAIVDNFEIPDSQDEMFISVLTFVGGLKQLSLATDDVIEVLVELLDDSDFSDELKNTIVAISEDDYAAVGKVVDFLYVLYQSAQTIIMAVQTTGMDSAFMAKDAMFVQLGKMVPTYEDFTKFSNLVYDIEITFASSKAEFVLVEKAYKSLSSVLYSGSYVVINLFKNFTKTFYNQITGYIGHVQDLIIESEIMLIEEDPFEFVDKLLEHAYDLSDEVKEDVDDVFETVFEIICDCVIDENPRALIMAMAKANTRAYQNIDFFKELAASVETSEQGIMISDYQGFINAFLKVFGLEEFLVIKDEFAPELVASYLVSNVSVNQIMALGESEDLGSDLEDLFGGYFEINLDKLPSNEKIKENLQGFALEVGLSFYQEYHINSFVTLGYLLYEYAMEFELRMKQLTTPVVSSVEAWINKSISEADIHFEELDIEFAEVNLLANGIVNTIMKYDTAVGQTATYALNSLKALSRFVNKTSEELPVFASEVAGSLYSFIGEVMTSEYILLSYVDGSEETEEAQAFLTEKVQDLVSSVVGSAKSFVTDIKPSDADYQLLMGLLGSFLPVSSEINYFDYAIAQITGFEANSDEIVVDVMAEAFFLGQGGYLVYDTLTTMFGYYLVDITVMVNFAENTFKQVLQDFMTSSIPAASEEEEDKPFADCSYAELYMYACENMEDFQAYVKDIYDDFFDTALEAFGDNDFKEKFTALLPYFSVFKAEKYLIAAQQYTDIAGLIEGLELDGEEAFGKFFEIFFTGMSFPMIFVPR